MVADVFVQNDRLWVRLHEKGGKAKLPLFPTLDRSSEQLTDAPLSRRNALDMVKRRARQAGVKTAICNHSFRGTGITTYLENGGELEKAAQMANHSSTRTTQLYDRRADEVTRATRHEHRGLKPLQFPKIALSQTAGVTTCSTAVRFMHS